MSEVREIVKTGLANPRRAFPQIKALAKSDDWAEREVSATALVEISKKQSEKIIAEMLTWSKDNNPNVLRTASEALRHIARKQPASVLPILENLKNDSSLYVRKSVANVIRNAGNYEPEFVLTLCSRWGLLHDANTNRIIKDALRKLKTTRPTEVGQILESLQRTRTE